jgi:pimeloyl-ACP methyl ester carboxylesterase
VADYVLVHGGWCGSWCFDRTAADLRAGGHRVLVPGLSGLGDRKDELTPAITLSTHVDDVVAQVEAAGIDRFILVGHSYGGMVITGVAARMGARIDALVYVDGFIPEDGESIWDISGDARGMWIDLQRETPGLMAPLPAWKHLPLTPQPLLTVLEPVRLTGEEAKVPRRIYIYATGYGSPYALYSEKTKNNPAWEYHEVGCGHFVMDEAPERMKEILLGAA